MRASVKLTLGFVLCGALASQASLAGEAPIVAKFNYSNPGISAVQFKRDIDFCIRKAGTLSFEDRPPNVGRSAGLGIPVRIRNSAPDPRQFNACMQDKSYRLDVRGPYDSGWISFRPVTRDS